MKGVEQKITKFLEDFNFKKKFSRILIAISGGIDSVVLTSVLIDLLGRDRLELAHYNHRLRSPEEQQKESVLLGSLVSQWGLEIHWGEPFEDLARLARSRHKSLEVLAREYRYRFLREVQAQSELEYLATAHHAGDQVETFLMRLMSKGSWRSLSGVRAQREGGLIRPMLAVTRQEVQAYAREKNLKFWEDSTNSQLLFTRNKVRHLVVPAIESTAPQAIESLLTWQERLCELYAWARPHLPTWQEQGKALILPVQSWQNLPAFLRAEQVLEGTELLFKRGLIALRPALTASFLVSLCEGDKVPSQGILARGHGIELISDNLWIILKSLLVKKKEISYLLRIKIGGWYSLPWGACRLESTEPGELFVASYDRRWDFWRGTYSKGKRFFSQWRQAENEEILLVVQRGQLVALGDARQSQILWRDPVLAKGLYLTARGHNA